MMERCRLTSGTVKVEDEIKPENGEDGDSSLSLSTKIQIDKSHLMAIQRVLRRLKNRRRNKPYRCS